MNLLQHIQSPSDLRQLPREQLRPLADELRAYLLDSVSKTGGHLSSNLGTVELTVALHRVFNTPHDRLVWDVGHQTYPHKILTGRRDRIRTLRQGGGLSGFTRRSESDYDPFGAAHSSTSISAALGMAVARDLGGDKRNVIAVIGDGAMSAGMAYEAMNNAGHLRSRLIVILNDNDMSIAPPVGAMSAYLSRLMSSRRFLNLRDLAARMAKKFGIPIIPHNTQTGASAVNIVQFASAVENIGGFMEFPHRGNEKKESWYTPEFKIRNGTVTVPSAPGLGIQFDPAYLAKAEKVTA